MADDASAFSTILFFDPAMVAELALGADHPHEIAIRYGLDETEYEHLAAQPWFEELVARKRQEYADDGVLFVAKAAMMAESLLTRLFQQSMAAVLPPPLMVEVAKQLSDIGRLKPQPAGIKEAVGPPFQINIQVNGREVVASHRPLVAAPGVTDTPASGAAHPAMTLDFTPDPILDAFPGPPQGLKVPDFDLRPSALVGTALAVSAAQGVDPLRPGAQATAPATDTPGAAAPPRA